MPNRQNRAVMKVSEHCLQVPHRMRRKMIQTKGKGDSKADKGMTVEAR